MNQSSFEQRVLEYAPSVRNFVRRQVKSKVDADDLAQDVLVKAFRSRHSLRDQARVQAWLFRIARRTITDYYRRQASTEELEDAAAESDESEEDVVSAAVARAALCYLDTLPEEYRLAVELADYAGLPHAQIAEQLGISLAATKSRVRRGKQRIRGSMEQCCAMVYDARGKVVDYERRRPCEGPTCD